MWDSEIAGLGIRVKPSGRKSFILKYRNAEGRQRKTTLGAFGSLTPEQARKLAMQQLGSVAMGDDPALEKKRLRNAKTIGELCDQYFEAATSGKYLYRGKPKGAATLANDKGHIERHIKPLLANKQIDTLSRSDVEQFMHDVKDGKTAMRVKTKPRGLAIVTGGAGAAKKSVSLLSSMFRYAIKEGMAETNPCQYVDLPADGKRTRFLNTEEYGKLGATLRNEQFTIPYETAGKAILVLALTGCRRNEILKLRREEVDIEGRCLRLSDTKTGAQIRPCGKAVLDILSDQLASHDSEWAFPSPKIDGPMVNIRKPMQKLCELAEFDDVTPHTLRHSYATVAHELGYSELTIAGLLGHSLGTVTSRYAHHVDHVLADAADKVSETVLQRLSSS